MSDRAEPPPIGLHCGNQQKLASETIWWCGLWESFLPRQFVD